MAFDYPNSPTVGQVFQGLVWDGEKWASALNPTGSGAVRYDMPQGLGANQMAQGRANISVTKKNYIINGAMMISQELGTTGGVVTGVYPVDQFTTDITPAGISTVQTALRTPGGSPTRLRVTATVVASPAAGDYLMISQMIEGWRIADLNFGTAAAKTFTVQFGVRAPAGTYSVTVLSSDNSRAYISEYTVSAGEANTDVVKSVTIPGDTTGTWAIDNTIGLRLRFCLVAGTSYKAAPNIWGGTANAIGSTNQSNFRASGSNVFDLFDVSLTEGSVAPPFQVPDYASELALCRRYYQAGAEVYLAAYTAASNTVGASTSFSPSMRANPTTTATSTGQIGTTGVPSTQSPTTAAVRVFWTKDATTGPFIAGATVTANARL